MRTTLTIPLDEPSSLNPTSRTVLATGSMALQGGVRLLLSILVGRASGPEILAQVMACLAAASMLSILWPTAAGTAATRFVAAGLTTRDGKESRQVAAELGRHALGSSVLLAPVGAIYWYWRSGILLESLIVAWLVVGLSMYPLVRGIAMATGHLRRLLIWDVVGTGVGVAGCAVLALIGIQGALLLAPLALGYTLICFFNQVPMRGEKNSENGEISHFILWGTLGSLASAGLIQLVMLVAEARLTPGTAGSFGAALSLIAPAALVANSLTMILFPSMSATFARGESTKALRMALDSTRTLVFIMTALFGILAIFSPWISVALWGEDFALASLIFPVLALGPLARAVSMPAVTSMSARGRDGVRHATLSTIPGSLAAALLWIGTGGDSWVTVALGYSGAMTLTAVSNIIRATVQDGHAWGWTWLRFVIAVASLAITLTALHRYHLGFWVACCIAGVLFVAWIAWNREVVNKIIPRGPASRPTKSTSSTRSIN